MKSNGRILSLLHDRQADLAASAADPTRARSDPTFRQPRRPPPPFPSDLGYLETAPEIPSAAPAPSEDTPSLGEILVPTLTKLPRHRVDSTLDPS